MYVGRVITLYWVEACLSVPLTTGGSLFDHQVGPFLIVNVHPDLRKWVCFRLTRTPRLGRRFHRLNWAYN